MAPEFGLKSYELFETHHDCVFHSFFEFPGLDFKRRVARESNLNGVRDISLTSPHSTPALVTFTQDTPTLNRIAFPYSLALTSETPDPTKAFSRCLAYTPFPFS